MSKIVKFSHCLYFSQINICCQRRKEPPTWQKRKSIAFLLAVGFEPTQLALVVLKTTPLDHSGKRATKLFILGQGLTRIANFDIYIHSKVLTQYSFRIIPWQTCSRRGCSLQKVPIGIKTNYSYCQEKLKNRMGWRNGLRVLEQLEAGNKVTELNQNQLRTLTRDLSKEEKKLEKGGKGLIE